jgi:hypothetical protein
MSQTVTLLVEGVTTDDGRIIERGASRWRLGPLPAFRIAQPSDPWPGHDCRAPIATLHDMRREANRIVAEIIFGGDRYAGWAFSVGADVMGMEVEWDDQRWPYSRAIELEIVGCHLNPPALAIWPQTIFTVPSPPERT